jgi:hypothetical protein
MIGLGRYPSEPTILRDARLSSIQRPGTSGAFFVCNQSWIAALLQLVTTEVVASPVVSWVAPRRKVLHPP